VDVRAGCKHLGGKSHTAWFPGISSFRGQGFRKRNATSKEKKQLALRGGGKTRPQGNGQKRKGVGFFQEGRWDCPFYQRANDWPNKRFNVLKWSTLTGKKGRVIYGKKCKRIKSGAYRHVSRLADRGEKTNMITGGGPRRIK